MKKFSHTDQQGNAKMVDVGDKSVVERKAIACGFIALQPETIQLIHENQMKKGDVLTVAKIAGIQAAKKTSDLIPLCHNLLINQVAIETRMTEQGVEVECTAKCTGKTGVEMEALTGVSVTLLTIYDMCKAVDKEMVIERVFLVEKEKEVR